MKRNLISIDWDYFIPIDERLSGSYIENKRNIMTIWYKRYFENKKCGINIEKSIREGIQLNSFLKKIKNYFNFGEKIKMYVSDSHKFSYDIAKVNKCSNIINFDAHSDLGYGGLKSIGFELNCANWLGKLLKNKIADKANIVYSPYTYEKPEEFSEINNIFNIKYLDIEHLPKIKVDAIHVCRSGSWTPPWLDYKFYDFIKSFNISYKTIDCPKRNWNPENLKLADKIYIML
ncbi:arginase [Clostridium tyrobutyricum]|jgi:hypothetical protein|uniref:Arginase n=1 Tax=Clostridium tyrobutyricum DIVETGP TaxID=1408889 RepID=W6N3T5_CLOTY|nr:hypothetical protein [Clostridium tyrobutyricum]AND84482.1 hypothetical protein CTK_C12210 [Clostridium tyrobutyricum]ANP69096.1 arginase [Clostridium tyrobutyricum]MBR9647590.1 arginase [Clostridium tyrobutyricum]MBV4424939.1 arginase [Clostridium tyrobutyricum]MBV4434875.1 arginase [Clostridium tyrobutyricum]